MLLRDWMRCEGIDDATMASRIGEISSFMVRALRYRQRGPSIRVAARIEAITAGRVRAADLTPAKAPAPQPSPEAVP